MKTHILNGRTSDGDQVLACGRRDRRLPVVGRAEILNSTPYRTEFKLRNMAIELGVSCKQCLDRFCEWEKRQ